MSKVYIAKQSIGEFRTGGEVIGLTDKDRIEYLLSIGAIEEANSDDKSKPATKAAAKKD
jgi:hypothetical protein